MLKTIFSLVGPSGCGKTSIIEGVVQSIPDKVGVVLSTTTRLKRDENELKHYKFVDENEFTAIRSRNGFVNSQNFAGNWYGTDKKNLDELLSSKHGIWAMVESAYAKLIKHGYDVRIIKIKPEGAAALARPERSTADRERSTIQIPTDLTVVNSFKPGGLDYAVRTICDYINKF